VDFNEVMRKVEGEWMESIEYLKTLKIEDSYLVLKRFVEGGRRILLEGAQGTLLDIYRGTYPYVTSSCVGVGGALSVLGLPWNLLGRVYGVAKCYMTRVGNGPFPTEVKGEMEEYLRRKGNEYGATTGRPRRCGWLDLPALKYATWVNGVTHLIITKVDVIIGLPHISVCIKYEIGSREYDYFSPMLDLEEAKPLYIKMEGWNDIRDSNLMKFVKFIEREIGVPVYAVSTGEQSDSIIELLKTEEELEEVGA